MLKTQAACTGVLATYYQCGYTGLRICKSPWCQEVLRLELRHACREAWSHAKLH